MQSRKRISSLSAYFTEGATAVINKLGDQFIARIDTDSGWYLETPSFESLMETLHAVRVWAGDQYRVSVVEDFDNTELSRVVMAKREMRGMQ